MLFELEKLVLAADLALDMGFAVYAGHDLTVDNLPALVNRVPKLAEVSIGHGFTADALQYDVAAFVQQYLHALQSTW